MTMTQQRLRELRTSGAPPGLIRIQEIILEAIGILRTSKVKTWDEEQCDVDVRRHIDNIWNSKPSSIDFAKQRKQLRATIGNLKKADRAIEKITSENSFYKGLQENHIRPALNATCFFLARITFKSGPRGRIKGAHRRRTAAVSAGILILQWTTKGLTLNANGPYYRLARLLYEAATGENPEEEGQVGLERACRDYAKFVTSYKKNA